MNVAVILAGGSGTRFGNEKPKQFMQIMEKPIIIYTLERIASHQEIDRIVVACIESYISKLQEWVIDYNIQKPIDIVSAGETFLISLINGYNEVCKTCKNDDDIIMLHMASSPTLSTDIISDSLSVCRQFGNAYAAESSYLCMSYKTGDNYSAEYLDRDKIVGLNTPQSHTFEKLSKIINRIKVEGIEQYKDYHLSTLMLHFGEKLFFSKSSKKNIKLTTWEDFELIKLLIEDEFSHGGTEHAILQ
jgi:2-C-methyl-D-erythritol 4-phosphate cytidylyltransferase